MTGKLEMLKLTTGSISKIFYKVVNLEVYRAWQTGEA